MGDPSAPEESLPDPNTVPPAPAPRVPGRGVVSRVRNVEKDRASLEADQKLKKERIGELYSDGGRLQSIMLGVPAVSDPEYLEELEEGLSNGTYERVLERDPKTLKDIPGKYVLIPRPTGKLDTYLPGLIDMVKTINEGDPTNPPSTFLKDFRQALGAKLSLTVEQMRSFRAYTSVATPLDRWLSTDAFLTLGMGKDAKGKVREILLSLDATLKPFPEKEAEFKDKYFVPDVLLGAMPDPLTMKKWYEEYLDEAVSRAAPVLKKKMIELE